SSVGPSSAEFGRRRARPKGLRLTGLLPAPLRRLGARIPPLKPRRLKGLGLGLLLGVALLACVTEQAPTLPPAVTPPEPEIRVRLFEHPLAKTATTTVGLQGAWQLQGESGASYGVVALRQPTLEVSLERGGLHVKGFDPLGTWLELLPQDDDATFTLNERTYLGALRLEPTASGKGLQATNTLGIEAYLLGVVGYESPLGWLDEALYSQAIAARTYALVGLKPTRDYDVVDDTRDQVYRGLMDTPEHRARLRKLVDGTRGVVVTYEGKPITTYFHSTCGGDTVPAEWIFPWVHEPFEPWSGASDCPCQASKYYRWEQPRELGKGQDPDAQSPAQALVLKLPLTAATIEHYPRGGYVKNLLLTDQTGEVTRVPGWEARRVFGLRGYAFDVQLGAGGMSLEFTGRGWGHGVGMCQFGAQGRAKQGWTHGQILANYYPGTQLVTLPYAAE
ncbi:MAG: SpoIID/LytB domain-containing protein, partial [Planctomycetes bacterium]|nr:SpoIID/LytB domain-containing protein [Planctomycetota bacterium]